MAALYIAIYRQVSDGSTLQTAKQADVVVGRRIDIQPLNGMTLSVKDAGIGGLIAVVRILADGRPFLIIQINVRSQHSADFGFIWGFGIIHLIPEPFQPLGGGNLIGVVLRAAAGGKRGGAGDRTVEYQYGFSP